MKFHQIRVVYLKEMTDILRDRRTLINMILIPIILFPVLTIGIGSLMGGQIKKMEKQRYQVLFLSQARAPELYEYLSQNEQIVLIDHNGDAENARRFLKDKIAQAVIVAPENFSAKLDSFFQGAPDSIALEILNDEAEPKSEIAGDKLREAVAEYRRTVVESQLRKLNLRGDFTRPFNLISTNVASQQEMGGFIAGMILPYMVIMLALVGAMYPAIDLTAGEKERGTLETLLIAPVGRAEMSIGKFLTVMTASFATAILAIISMTITLSQGSAMLPESSESAIDFALTLPVVIELLILMIPLTMMFSALLMALALFARSYREAQSYISPLMILVIVPAMVSYLPGIEPDFDLALIPVVNVALMLKTTMTGDFDVGLVAVTFLASLVYASGAIWVAFRQFQRESVLFRV